MPVQVGKAFNPRQLEQKVVRILCQKRLVKHYQIKVTNRRQSACS